MNAQRILIVALSFTAQVALAIHPVPPEALTQRIPGGATIPTGGTVTQTTLELTATSDSLTCDSSILYQLELEVRPVGTPFTGTPTHTSPTMSKPDCQDIPYPWTTMTLAPGTYRWQVREKLGSSTSTWVQFNAGNPAFTIAAVQVTPSTVAFGGQAVGLVSAPQTITVSNDSGVTHTIGSVAVTGPFTIASGPSLPVSLPTGQTLLFDVTTNPQSMGNHTGTFTVTSTALNSPHVAQLSVTGAQSQLTLAPAAIDFGEWGINGAPSSRQLLIQNTGNAPMTVQSVTASGPFTVTGFTQDTTVAATASTSLTVEFLPTATGLHGGTVTVTSNAPGSPHTLTVEGTGTAPQLALAPSSLTFPDVRVGQQSAPLTFTIGNTGIGTLNLLAPQVTGPFTTTLVPGSIPENGSQPYTVTFQPTAPGPISGTVSIPSDSAGSPNVLTLSGIARAAVAEVTPAQVAFGTVALGASQTGTITLANTGDAPLTVTAMSVSSPVTGEFVLTGQPPLPFTLAPGATQQFAVRFRPNATGNRTGTLNIQSNRYPAGVLSVPLAGEGEGESLSVSANSLAFGAVTVGSIGSATLTLTNSGNAPLTVSGLVVSGNAASDYIAAEGVPFTLAPAATQQVTVQFTPTQGGARNATLHVVSSDGLRPSIPVTLTGSGTSPSITVAPLNLSWGQVRVGQSSTRTFSLQNTGTGPLTVSSLQFLGNSAPRFTVSGVGTPFTVPPNGAPVNVQVAFQPTSVGAANGTLHVVSDDPQAPSIQLALDGEGIAPALSLSTTTLTFGAQVVARPSAARTFEIHNPGSAALQVFSLGITGQSASAFRVEMPTGQFSIPAGESRTVSVVMTAPALGESAARLNIQSDRPGSGSAHVDLVGLGISEVLALSPTTLDFGVVKAGTSSQPLTVTLSNLSSETLQMSPAMVTGTGAPDFQVVFTSAQVEPLGTVTARVTYKPQAAGQHGAVLTLASSDTSVPPASVNLSGTSVSQILEAQPIAHDFGAVPVGNKVTQTFEVTNKTQSPLALASISSSAPAFVVEPGAPGTLEPGVAAQITVSFTPAVEGPAFATIGLALEGQAQGQSELNLSVSGVGTPAQKDSGGCSAAGGPALGLLLLGLVPALRRRKVAGRNGETMTRRMMKALGAVVPLVVALSAGNTWAAHPMLPLALKQETVGGVAIPAGGMVAGTTVRLTASSNELTFDSIVQYRLDLEIRPMSTPFTGTPTHQSVTISKPNGILLEYPFIEVTGLASGDYRWQVREVAGSSTSAWERFNNGNAAFTIGGVQLTPSTLAFGGRKVGATSAPMTVTLENQGTTPETITSTSFTGPFSLQSGPSLPVVVPPGGQLVFEVVATPATIGNHTGTFRVQSTAVNSPHTVTLSVTGSDPAVTLNPTSVSFGDWGFGGAPASRTVTLSNTGNAPLTVSGGTTTGPFGISGLAGRVVNPGQNIQIPITFSPPAPGSHTGTFFLHSDAPGSPHQVALTGNGVSPQLALAPATLTFPPVIVGEQSAPLSFDLDNGGTAPLNVLAPTMTGPFTTTLVAGTVAAGASQTQTVTFVPTAPGPVVGTLVIPSDAAGPSRVLTLNATATAPIAEVTPASVSLGSVALGAFGESTLTLRNNGDAVLTVTGLSIAGGEAGEYTIQGAPAVPFTVAPNATQTFDVRFEPSTVGPRSALLTLTSNTYPAGVISVPVAGEGTGAVQSLSASAFDFGTVNLGATGHGTLTLANSGNQALTVSGLTFSGGAAAEFATTTSVPATVAPGEALKIGLTFQPTMGGARASTLTIVSNDPIQPSTEVQVTGVGQSPSVTVSPVNLAFGQVRVGQSDLRTFSVQNTGTGPLTITDMTITGPDAERFSRQPGLVPMTLQPGSTARVMGVTFTPAAVGQASAQVTLLTDDVQNPSVQVSLEGEGIAPTLMLSDTSLSFGAQIAGRTSSPRAFEIHNGGTAPLQVFSLALTGANASSFSVAQPNGPFVVPPGESREVSMVVTPSSAGEFVGRLNIQSDAAGGGNAQLDLTALGISDVLTVTPASVDFGVHRVGSTSPEVEVTLTNLSGETLPLAPAQIAGAHVADFQVTFSATAIEPNGTVTARVAYRPQGGGTHTGTLRLRAADTRVAPVTVSLTGSAVSRVLESPSGTRDFGEVQVGEQTTQELTLTNKTDQAVTIAGYASTHPAFTVDEAAPTTVPANGQVTFTVTFAPTAAGSATGGIGVTISGQSAPELTVGVVGSGRATPGDGQEGGCSAVGGPSLLWLLAGLAVPALRRRRRQA